MILALDPSRYTGWCAGVPGSKPKFGLWDVSALRAGGPRFGGYCDLLADAITIHAPFLVVTEVDVSLHRQNPDATARQQIGMACLTELICWRRGVEYREATAGDARKAVLGSAMFGAGGEAKRASWTRCSTNSRSTCSTRALSRVVLTHWPRTSPSRA